MKEEIKKTVLRFHIHNIKVKKQLIDIVNCCSKFLIFTFAIGNYIPSDKLIVKLSKSEVISVRFVFLYNRVSGFDNRKSLTLQV